MVARCSGQFLKYRCTESLTVREIFGIDFVLRCPFLSLFT